LNARLFWNTLVVQAIVVAVPFAILGLALDEDFFEDWGWLAGPAAWLVCALATAVVVRLPPVRVLVGAALTGLLPLLRRLPVPFVVDHMGRIEAARGLTDPAFTALLGLAAQPNAWVKISGIDRIGAGKRPFHEGLPFMRALAEAMPERTLWGTDWPHPNVRGDMPDDGEVVDALFEAVPDAGLRQSILVDNPARLYGFDAR